MLSPDFARTTAGFVAAEYGSRVTSILQGNGDHVEAEAAAAAGAVDAEAKQGGIDDDSATGDDRPGNAPCAAFCCGSCRCSSCVEELNRAGPKAAAAQ